MKDDKKKKGSKVGVYICHCGGNISDVVDIEKVLAEMGDVEGVTVSKQHMFMCSDPGQTMVVDDIKAEGLDRVVIAACSPSLHEFSFRNALKRAGLNPYLYDHANIREQASWCSKNDPEGATNKASKIVSASIEKVKLARPLEKIKVKATKAVAVIGAGLSGLRSAIDLSKRGMKVVLVEKSNQLGGQLLKLDKLFPTNESSQELLNPLIKQVEEDNNIEVCLESELISTTGLIGNFEVEVKTATGKKNFQVGALVLATGFKNYIPPTGNYGYGESENIVTLQEFQEILIQNNEKSVFEYNGKKIKSIGFIHCVGSRQVEGIDEPSSDGKLNDYCSRYCCTSLLHTENRLKDQFKEIELFDFYQDIRTYGRGHEEYYSDTSKKGVLFFRWTNDAKPEVLLNDNNIAMKVRVKDTLTFGKEVDVPVDLLVLATAMIPPNIDNLVEILKLPRSADGFLQEVHPKLQPVEVAVAGVFIAGSCQAPMNITESCSGGSAAAAKATTMLAKDHIELDPFIAEVDSDLCVGGNGCNLECIQECGEKKVISIVTDTIDGKEMKIATVDETLCDSCGMCVAVCPEGAIQLAGQHLSQFDAMVDAIIK